MFLGRSLLIATQNSIEHQVLVCVPSGCLPNNGNEQLSIVSFCAAWRASLRRCQCCCHCCCFSLLLSAVPKTTLRAKLTQYLYSILRSQRNAASKYLNSLGFCGWKCMISYLGPPGGGSVRIVKLEWWTSWCGSQSGAFAIQIGHRYRPLPWCSQKKWK